MATEAPDVRSTPTPWETVLLARHPGRPTALTYLETIFTDFVELHGDRLSSDDPALIGGPARLGDTPVMVLAHGRGRSDEEGQQRNRGATRPAGFRKAQRLARLADRLGLPIITLIDTPGAYPGASAEESGQALAIATTIEALVQTQVPIVACVIGEGGSGGAVALSVSDRLLMMQYAVFEVISPEACSSILFRDGAHAEFVANALHLTAPALHSLGLIDEIVPEPAGGAQRDPPVAGTALKNALMQALNSVAQLPREQRLDARHTRIRRYGDVAFSSGLG